MNEIITPKIYIEWVNILNLLKERKNFRKNGKWKIRVAGWGSTAICR